MQRSVNMFALRPTTSRSVRRMDCVTKVPATTLTQAAFMGRPKKSATRVTMERSRNLMVPFCPARKKKPVSTKSKVSLSEFCFQSTRSVRSGCSNTSALGRFEEWFQERRNVRRPKSKIRSRSLSKKSIPKWSTMSLEDLEMMPETQHAIARHVLADICSLAACTPEEVYVKMKILRAKYSLPLEKFLDLPETPFQINVLDKNPELKKIVMERPTLRKTFVEVQERQNKIPNTRSKSSGIERTRSSVIQNGRSSETERARFSGIGGTKSSVFERTRRSGIELTRSSGTERLKSAGSEHAKRSGIECAKNPRMQHTRYLEIKRPRSSSIEFLRSSAIDRLKNLENGSAKSHGIKRTKSSRIEGRKSSELEHFMNSLFVRSMSPGFESSTSSDFDSWRYHRSLSSRRERSESPKRERPVSPKNPKSRTPKTEKVDISKTERPKSMENGKLKTPQNEWPQSPQHERHGSPKNERCGSPRSRRPISSKNNRLKSPPNERYRSANNDSSVSLKVETPLSPTNARFKSPTNGSFKSSKSEHFKSPKGEQFQSSTNERPMNWYDGFKSPKSERFEIPANEHFKSPKSEHFRSSASESFRIPKAQRCKGPKIEPRKSSKIDLSKSCKIERSKISMYERAKSPKFERSKYRPRSSKHKKKKNPYRSTSDQRLVKMNYENFPYMFYETIPAVKARSITCLARTKIDKTKSDLFLVPCKRKFGRTRKIEDWLQFPETPLIKPQLTNTEVLLAENLKAKSVTEQTVAYVEVNAWTEDSHVIGSPIIQNTITPCVSKAEMENDDDHTFVNGCSDVEGGDVTILEPSGEQLQKQDQNDEHSEQ